MAEGSARRAARLGVTMAQCEWSDPVCTQKGTHLVRIEFPGEAEESWTVCREHDRQLKIRAVASRQPQPASGDRPAVVVVHCAGCDRILDEASELRVESRQPCSACGSTQRQIAVTLSETLSLRGTIQAVRRQPERGSWLLKVRAGDDYTRDLGAWGTRELLRDKEQNRYRELITLYDGTKIESVAKLTDHHE
jgi:hypothetical protein